MLARAEDVYSSAGFSVELDLPELASGRYYLKAYAWNDQLDAIGSLAVDMP